MNSVWKRSCWSLYEEDMKTIRVVAAVIRSEDIYTQSAILQEWDAGEMVMLNGLWSVWMNWIKSQKL